MVYPAIHPQCLTNVFSIRVDNILVHTTVTYEKFGPLATNLLFNEAKIVLFFETHIISMHFLNNFN